MLAYHQKRGQQTQSQETASEPEYDNENVSEGNIKTMQRVLGLEETGKWTEQDRTGAGGLSAAEAWKDYQQGKLQSRSKSGMSPTAWAKLQNTSPQSSDAVKEKQTTPDVQSFRSGMMTKEQALQRGITATEWEAMVIDRLNHVNLSVDEFEQLEKYYGLDIKGGTSDTTDTSDQKMSYAEYREKTAAKKVADLQAEAERYFRDYQAFSNSAVYDSQNIAYHNAASMLESRIQTAADLRERADTLLTSLETGGDILSGDYSELLTLISATREGVDSVMDFFGEQARYYSNLPNLAADYYDSEISRVTSEMEDLQAQREDYINNTWTDWTDYTSRQKYTQGLSDIEAEIEKIGAQKYQLEEGKQYQIMRLNPDYAELSKQKPIVDYVPNLSSNAASIHIQERNFYDNMTQDQIADYNYLYAKEGKEAADRYVAYISSDVNARIQAELNKTVSTIADKAPITSSLLSTPIKLMGGAGLVDVSLQKLERELTGSYKPIDYNTPSMSFTNAGNAIRGTVSQKIADATGVIDFDEEKHPVLSRLLNGKSLADVYQLGMSMQDSAAIAGLAAINPALGKVGTVLLSTSSGTDAMLNAVSKGASDEQALTMGILTAGFEMIFEKYELESLLGQGKNVWQALWKQGLSEAAGEGATEAANILADVAVMAEKSDWKQNIQRYLAENPDWDYNQAAKQAFVDAALQVGEASVGGWISGSIMGGGYSGIQNIVDNVQNNQQAYNLYGQVQQELVNEALELNPNNVYAQKLQGKLDSGKQLSGAQLRKLVAQNDSAIQKQDTQNATTSQIDKVNPNTTARNGGQLNATVQATNNQANAAITPEDVTNMLKSKRVDTKTATSITDAIAASLNGQELTKTQSERLSSVLDSPTVLSVISELMKKKAAAVDSAQNRVYDNSDVPDGLTDEEKSALWNLANQSADAFRNDDHITATEGSPVPQSQNTSLDGAFEGDADVIDDIITDGSHLEKGKLKPNVTYKTGEHDYLYTTNEDGLIVNARTDDLQEKDHEGRLEHNPNTYGKEPGDHAGHLFGDRFGGSPELDNLVSQAKNVNLSEYKVIENQWAQALENGQKVRVNIDIHYDEGSARPSSFDVSYMIDDVSYNKIISNQ